MSWSRGSSSPANWNKTKGQHGNEVATFLAAGWRRAFLSEAAFAPFERPRLGNLPIKGDGGSEEA